MNIEDSKKNEEDSGKRRIVRGAGWIINLLVIDGERSTYVVKIDKQWW